MKIHFASPKTFSILLVTISLIPFVASAQKRRLPAGGRLAIVVDERLSALRTAPELSARLLRRLGRGRFVAISGEARSRDGVVFYRVNVTTRTRGWLQREAVVSINKTGDDKRLMSLIEASEDFDLIARGRIFLDSFPHSALRPTVLLLFGRTAEAAAAKLSRDAGRRLKDEEMIAGRAPEFSYFMNYNGLDRYNRQGIRFVFDAFEKKFHYDGATWREIVRRYPYSPEASEALERLQALRLIQHP
jgi:hypothetical protein